MPKTVNVGLIGYAFMGKAHSSAFRDVPMYFPDVKLKPVMKSICGRDERGVREAANRFGWEEYETDAMKMIKRPDIDVIDVCSPGWAHKDQVIAAANVVAATANSGMGALFGPGTDKPIGDVKTRVKPELFTEGENVGKLAGDFTAAANNLAKVAATGDAAAMKTAFGEMGKACKACHDRYRAED
jgi:hypothetical protein